MTSSWYFVFGQQGPKFIHPVTHGNITTPNLFGIRSNFIHCDVAPHRPHYFKYLLHNSYGHYWPYHKQDPKIHSKGCYDSRIAYETLNIAPIMMVSQSIGPSMLALYWPHNCMHPIHIWYRTMSYNVYGKSLGWRHNGCDGVSNHQPHDCLLNRLFRLRSKKTPKLSVTGLCAGNSPVR